MSVTRSRRRQPRLVSGVVFVVLVALIQIYFTSPTAITDTSLYSQLPEPHENHHHHMPITSSSSSSSSLRLTSSDGKRFSNNQKEKQEAPVAVATAATLPYNSRKAWSNVTTYAFAVRDIYSGYRNQMMAFTMLILRTKHEGHGQFLVNSVRQKDTYGSNQYVPFDFLWDVDHWNSYYSAGLPRLVDYDPILHDQWDPDTQTFRELPPNETITTRPYGNYQKIPKLMAGYQRYIKGKGTFANNLVVEGGHRNPAEILMFQGALKPHPVLQAIIDRILLLHKMGGSNHPYMTLHARIEPDMQRHPMCPHLKVTNLTDIIHMLEQHFPDGPPGGISTVFVPVNRHYLEEEGSYPNKRDPSKTNWIAVENLRVLNRIVREGLWKGQARVLEFGSKELKGSRYEERASTAGAILNYFLAIGATVFVGTEVSSYSHDLLATRFYRNHMENYNYRPDGLHPWTPTGTVDPPGHLC